MNMRKVMLEMEKLRYPATGLGQFCSHLGEALVRKGSSDVQIHAYLPKNKFGVFGNHIRYHEWKRWNKWFFPGNSGYDVWHCMHQDSAYLPSKRTKLLLTVHDLNFLQKYTGAKLNYRLQKLQKIIDRSSGVAVISCFTEKILREHIRVPDIPVRVIYNGNPLIHFPNESRPKNAPDGKFFFAIGVLSPRKNFHVLPPVLNGFPDYELVIAGPEHSDYSNRIRQEAAKWKVSDRIRFVGEVNDPQKYWYYKNSEALLFPSLSEGFGLPVVEAMSLGKPVFLSRLTSLPEVGGESAWYFEDFNPETILETVNKGMNQFVQNPEMKSRIMDQAAKFSWDNAALDYIDFYQSL